MTFDSWLCNPLIQEDSKVHFYHPTETPTLQQDIFTLMWAEAGANQHHHHHWVSVWEEISYMKISEAVIIGLNRALYSTIQPNITK